MEFYSKRSSYPRRVGVGITHQDGSLDMVFLNAGRINLNLYVCGMYLSQCETILSQIQMFSYPFKMYKIY